MAIDERGKRIAPRTHLDVATSKYVQAPVEKKSTIQERKARFEAINDEIRKAGGWVTSVPGDRYVDFEVLPAIHCPPRSASRLSPMATVLHQERRWDALALDRGQHAAGLIQGDARRHRARRQILLPDRLTPGSTERVAQTVVHAGICKTRRFRFDLQPPRVAADDADGRPSRSSLVTISAPQSWHVNSMVWLIGIS